MPVPFFIPPWLTPPDPVQTYQRGVQIGAQIGAEQTRQRIAQMQTAQQAHEMDIRQAQWEAEIGLKAAETARRVQGQLRYRQLVESGVDPLDAMMRTPEIYGESMGGLAQAAKAAEMEKRYENFVPSVIDKNGVRFAQYAPGRFHPITPEKTTPNVGAPVTDPKTGKILGWWAGERFVENRAKPEGLNLVQRANIQRTIATMTKDLALLEDGSKEKMQLESEIQSLRDMLKENALPSPAASPPTTGTNAVSRFIYDAQTRSIK